MANPWFRLYSEFEDDPKVQMMSEAMQRRFVMLMCSRCKGVKLTEMQMSFKWRITAAEVQETKACFIEQGFIDEHWELVNWNRRQFVSDSSTDRVRQYRERLKQDETLQGNDGNVTVTAPDTDTDSEQKQIKKQKVSKATPSHPDVSGKVDPIEAIYQAYPRKEGKRTALERIRFAVKRLVKGEKPHSQMTREEALKFLWKKTAIYAKSPAGSQVDQTKIPHPATWFNQSRYLDDQQMWNLTGDGNGNRANQSASKLERSRETSDGAWGILNGGEGMGSESGDHRRAVEAGRANGSGSEGFFGGPLLEGIR